jgi:hypothetical protein
VVLPLSGRHVINVRARLPGNRRRTATVDSAETDTLTNLPVSLSEPRAVDETGREVVQILPGLNGVLHLLNVSESRKNAHLNRSKVNGHHHVTRVREQTTTDHLIR